MGRRGAARTQHPRGRRAAETGSSALRSLPVPGSGAQALPRAGLRRRRPWPWFCSRSSAPGQRPLRLAPLDPGGLRLELSPGLGGRTRSRSCSPPARRRGLSRARLGSGRPVTRCPKEQRREAGGAGLSLAPDRWVPDGCPGAVGPPHLLGPTRPGPWPPPSWNVGRGLRGGFCGGRGRLEPGGSRNHDPQPFRLLRRASVRAGAASGGAD